MIRKILKYIFRGWENETDYVHPLMKILPPFFFEFISFLIALAIIVSLIKWAFNLG